MPEEEAVGAQLKVACPGCGYGAMVAGGYSLMMSAQTQTVSCASCRELTDVVTRSFELGNFPPPRDGGDEVAPEAPPQCREDKSHEVSLWEAGGPCPRCGEVMKAGEGWILTD